MVKTTNQLSMLIFFQPPAVLAMQVTGHYQSVTKSVAPGAATLAAGGCRELQQPDARLCAGQRVAVRLAADGPILRLSMSDVDFGRGKSWKNMVKTMDKIWNIWKIHGTSRD